MAPKRGRSFGEKRGNPKRKKMNLMTIRQSSDFRKYGEIHPADHEVKTTKYTKVKDRKPEIKSRDNEVSSSSDSEEEAPVLEQLLQEIGVKAEEPGSEQEEDDDDEEENSDDMENEEEIDELEDEGEEIDDDEVEEESDGEEEDLDDNDEGNFFDDAAEEDNGFEDEDEYDDSEDNGYQDEYDDSEDNEDDSEDNDEETNVTVVQNGEKNQRKKSKSLNSKEDKDTSSKTDDTQKESKKKKTSKKKKALDISSDEDDVQEKDEEDSLKELDDTQKESKKKKTSKKKKALDISSDEDDVQEKDEEDSLKELDPFTIHLEREVDVDDFVEKNKVWVKKEMKVPGLGKCNFSFKDTDCLRDIKSTTDLKSVHVKHKLCNRVATTNTNLAGVDLKEGESLSSFQHKLFNVLNTYQDLLYPKQTVGTIEDIRLVYCLHVLNHILKARSRITAHNVKLKSRLGKSFDEDVEYRDQGLTRPKVVILLPYREKAKKVVNMFIHLLSASEKLKAESLNRFLEEYSEIETRAISARRYKAEDYIQMFEGNIDDNFRLGLSISKGNVKLYTPLFASDVILASPLGLRTLIGDPGDKDREFEFLSSIEMLIMDQSDAFLMQNWDHVTHSLRHFHQQPSRSHDVDFSRVRMWAIDGLSKYFRQTIIFSSILLPELTSIFNKYCHNYCGKIMVDKTEKIGSVRSCLSDVPQIFHKVSCSKADGVSQRNAKMEYFRKKILSLHNSAGMHRTLIYCNYFSFVTLRNMFREENVFFLFIHEYDRENDIKKNRVKFRKLNPPFLFYTERLHFHYRFRMRGVYHIVWFDLPQYPIFYPELVNLMDVTKQACTSTALFTKYEGQKLMEIVGQKNASHMLNSEKNVNMITVS